MARRKKDINAAFGEALRRARDRAGISQEELAHRCGVHRTYVSQLERGLKSPSLGVVVALAEELGVEAWRLVREAESAG